ncbi:unnamed protein product [Clavelina lepadiformis]|uniref:VWFD domain-containing protein n=1 Tax=Clavelina lepadiformis TaxID=159417 RepID=A0ABP0GYI4_CLALP
MGLLYLLPVLVVMLSTAGNNLVNGEKITGRCYGDVHYEQFDGDRFSDQTAGAYVCSSTKTSFSPSSQGFLVTIVTVTETRRGLEVTVIDRVIVFYGYTLSFSFDKPPSTTNFTISPPNYTPSAVEPSGRQVFEADDKSYKLTYDDGAFELEFPSSDNSSPIFEVRFDGMNCIIRLDRTIYGGQLTGILGNGDGTTSDDRLNRGGSTIEGVAAFIASWPA